MLWSRNAAAACSLSRLTLLLSLMASNDQSELVGKRPSFVKELSSVLSLYLKDSSKLSSEELTSKLEKEDYQKFVVLVEWIRQFRKN